MKQPLQVFCKSSVLKIFAKFTRQLLYRSLFFSEVSGLRPATFFMKKLRHRCFPMNFAISLRTPFLHNTSNGWFSLSTWSKLFFIVTLDYIVDRCFSSSYNIYSIFNNLFYQLYQYNIYCYYHFF